jgi:putative transcriptional regulator
MPDIISHLRDYRQKLGVTQEALAEQLGVTRQTVIALEQGKYQPTLHLAAKCARFFQVSIDDIFSFPDV